VPRLDYGWGGTYDPFFGFRKLPEEDPYEAIQPFTVQEQKTLLEKIPEHWQPFLRFAFCTGLRQGEQVSLRPEDVDWDKGLIHIRRALTRDEQGKPVEGTTKNKYSRRTIKLLPVMRKALEQQRIIQENLKSKYLFCSETGCQVHAPNVYRRVWEPALKAAKLEVREMMQTRHTFATVALSCGENPTWIARVMGHRNTDMLIRVYACEVRREPSGPSGREQHEQAVRRPKCKYRTPESQGGSVDGRIMANLWQNDVFCTDHVHCHQL
jgi:integrase